jgi:peptidoglycan-associated lipoprotein
MKKSRSLVVLVLLAMVIAFSGCSSKGKPKDEGGPGSGTPGISGPGGIGQPGGEGPGGADGSGAQVSGMPSERLVYFDYNRSDIRADARAVLEAHAAFLAAHPTNIRLEGHADERGSREYNLALGERRAESVKRTLVIMGVTESLMNTLSYGKERPIDPGHDESAWQRNRRVEIIYP